MSVEPLFLPIGEGTRFGVLHHAAAGVPVRGAVVFVHPFAEELNKSRRMAAAQSRAFANAGWTTLQLDLFGCGDSPGDFSEARWPQWVDDVLGASHWLRERTGHEPIIWSLRAGCLIAAEAARRMAHAPNHILWQPVLSGKQYLQQFLRLKAASELMGQKGEQVTGNQELRKALARGEVVEIAGYPLTAELASGLESTELELPPGKARIAWLEIRSSGGDIMPASRTRIGALERAGHQIAPEVVTGPAFWHLVESETSPALIRSTLSAAEAMQS